MFHVFEHLANPNDVMRKIWSVLSDNGHLVIEVPNIHQADASPHNIYFKAHLFYYSRYSLMCAASQYFELVCVEDAHNLFMAFRKRHQPLVMRVAPSISQIKATAIRLEQKGWKEYLTVGGGWSKVFARAGKWFDESRIKRLLPARILDRAWETGTSRRPVMIGVGLATSLALAMEAYF